MTFGTVETLVLEDGILTFGFADGSSRSFSELSEEERWRRKRVKGKEQWERKNSMTVSTRSTRELVERYKILCSEHGTTPYKHLRDYVENSVDLWDNASGK